MQHLTTGGEYSRELEAERQAWMDVKDSLPGSSTFDHMKWERWRAANHAVRIAMDLCHDRITTIDCSVKMS
jgi:hypothetical protein